MSTESSKAFLIPASCRKCGNAILVQIDEQPAVQCIICSTYIWLTKLQSQPGKEDSQPRLKKPSRVLLNAASRSQQSPPRPPKKDLDWPLYETECGMYAAITWFLQQATRFHQENRSTALQRDRWQATYRAGLCEQLAGRLAQLRESWNRSVGRKFFASQRKAGHVNAIQNKRFTGVQKQLHRLMLRSVQWMPNDPRIRSWYSSRQLLGDRDFLRMARKGLEKGVLRPKYPQKVEVDHSLNDHIHSLRQKGFSTRHIASELRRIGYTISHTTVATRLKI